ncbi:MAG: HAMP domain-containing histidine kinase, partial [Chloroflexia bacterium]|nr:HAMP domain-containing histidine kinase [Chloroflexia bacterium]
LPLYGLADLAFAEELGRRAALALDNGRLLREAQSAVSLRDEFLSSASHDLKNPLTAIRGRVQLLLRRAAKDGTVPPDRLIGGLKEIEAAAEKMQRMIDELQDVSSLQLGRELTFERRPTDLVQLARDMIHVSGEISTFHQVILEDGEPDLIVDVDPGRIGRVLDNLISNAIKYSPDGGEVTVTVRQVTGEDDGREWAEIAVRDRGIGIPATDLPRLFERFFRGSNVSDQIGGSGIGLAGVHLIVTQHGGTVSVDSTEGEGSTFTVRLPLE